MFKIIKYFLVIFILFAALGSNQAQSAAPPPSSTWDDGESNVYTTPQRYRDSAPAGLEDLIKPLPRSDRQTQQEQQDALNLSWELRLATPPQKIAGTPPDEASGKVAAKKSEEALPGAVFGDAFGPLLVQPELGTDSLKPALRLQKRFPDWLRESPLWLFIDIASNIEDSYFYAPFALGQSQQERLDTADSVMPTQLEIIDENGEAVSGVNFYYPSGHLKQDIFSGLRLPVYQNKIIVAASIPGTLLGKTLSLKINALICTESSCTPFRKVYSLALQPGDIASGPLDSALAAGLMDYQTAPFGGVQTQTAKQTDAPRKAVNTNLDILDEAVEKAALESRLSSYLGSITPQYHTESLEVSNLGRAVGLGLLAGLILNFMPCVLPVISLKLGTLLGLGGWQGLESGGETARRNRRRFRLYGLCFTLGVFAWFGMLFGVIGFAGMMWGQFFQSQELILGLAMLLFVMALGMFGIVRIPLLNVQVEKKASLPYQAFFGGLLATLLATPCSGPLLGGVLGWAVNQSIPYLGATLLAVAVGMSSPFILMTISPGLARFLPKPGPWMTTLERIMGFVLLATVIYLLSMLAQAKIFVVLGALLALAFSAWLWSRPIAAGKSRISLGRVLALVLLIPALYLPFSQRVVDTSWKNFNAAAFQGEIGKRSLLIDFTADWCINCRAMELTTLTEQRLEAWAKAYDLIYIKVDLTASNPEGEALLSAMGSASIPLLAIIPAHDPNNPTVLRDLVTPGQLDGALKQAFRKR